MKFHLISLGCTKNTVDSEGVAGFIQGLGWKWSDSPEKAQVILINTCGFIRDAKEESLKKLMGAVRLKTSHPGLQVVAFGCLIKRYHQEIRREIPELDYLFEFPTPESLERLATHFSQKARKAVPCKVPRRFFSPPHIGFLKIAEGCDNRCSYCAIPEIRGAFESKPFEMVKNQVETLVKSGAREIIVVAQDTSNFGRDRQNPAQLSDLLKYIGTFSEVTWIRLQYLHPKRISSDFLESIYTLPKVVPYFDIPFQHVSDRLLDLMNRQTKQQDLVSLLAFIRRRFPQAVVRTTFIVGFPSETEAEFQELLGFIEEHPFDRLGGFAYSPEEQTPAAKLKSPLSQREKNRRLDELMTLQQVLSPERNQQWIGRELTVIVDRIEQDVALCRSYGDSPEVDNLIHLRSGSLPEPGNFVQVKIAEAEAYDLYAVPVTAP